MSFFENVMRTICPASGYAIDYAKSNPEQAKKIAKITGNALMKAICPAAGHAIDYAKNNPEQAKEIVKTAGQAALHTTTPGLLYQAAAQNPKETKFILDSTKSTLNAMADIGLFGLAGKLFINMG